MIIGIDIRALQGHAGGVQEYTRNIVKTLITTEKRHQYILFANSFRNPVPPDINPKGPHHQLCILRLPNKFLHASLALCGWPRIDELLFRHAGRRVDVMFYPNINFIAHAPKCRSVITIHDLSFVHCPDLYTLKNRLWHRAVRPRMIAKRATHILAVSRATRDDLIRTYDIDEGRITVTPLDCASEFKTLPRIDEGCTRDYILLFGADHMRKNADGLCAAFLHARKRSLALARCTLVLIGRGITRGRLCVKRQSDEGIVCMESVSHHDRIRLYRRAALVAFPSFMEGFGIPLLEAAHMRVPIMTANHSSIGEVIGNGAYHIDPYNVADMGRAITEVLTNSALATSLADAAYAAARAFSWNTTAAATRSVFERTMI